MYYPSVLFCLNAILHSRGQHPLSKPLQLPLLVFIWVAGSMSNTMCQKLWPFQCFHGVTLEKTRNHFSLFLYIIPKSFFLLIVAGGKIYCCLLISGRSSNLNQPVYEFQDQNRKQHCEAATVLPCKLQYLHLFEW